MTSARTFFCCLLLAFAGQAFASEAVPWRHPDFQPEFKYFLESGSYDAESWEARSPEEQERALAEAKAPAAERLEAVRAYFEEAMQKWDSSRLRDHASHDPESVAAVKLWLGQARGAALEQKLSVVRAMIGKARSEDGLGPEDEAALRPYLAQEAITDLRAFKISSELKKQEASRPSAGRTSAETKLGRVSGEVGGRSGQGISKFFDGNAAAGGGVASPVSREMGDLAARGAHSALGSPSRSGPAGAIAAPIAKEVSGFAAENASSALGVPAKNAPAATTVRSAAPAPIPGAGKPAETKSKAWTSDAYGYTITTSDGRTSTYRSQREAETAIRALPDGSVKKVIFYGHGSPGAQTVGDAYYEAGDAAELLKGKMARGGVVQYSGCNTSSIGGATINPAVGISMLARRVLYFSVPYIQDRISGVPADQAKQQWEKTWNADLSRDTSLQMKGAIVCGYRTFGLVPGRMPGLTRAMGNQEATTPGYVAGKKVCYQDGREVPEP